VISEEEYIFHLTISKLNFVVTGLFSIQYSCLANKLFYITCFYKIWTSVSYAFSYFSVHSYSFTCHKYGVMLVVVAWNSIILIFYLPSLACIILSSFYPHAIKGALPVAVVECFHWIDRLYICSIITWPARCFLFCYCHPSNCVTTLYLQSHLSKIVLPNLHKDLLFFWSHKWFQSSFDLSITLFLPSQNIEAGTSALMVHPDGISAIIIEYQILRIWSEFLYVTFFAFVLFQNV
jgi:hypothetical protein